MSMITVSPDAMLERFAEMRRRTRALFDLLDPAFYYARPIALRNPIVFYEGHLPAFNVIAFLRRGLGRDPVDERLERLFARGIDPESAEAAMPRSGADTRWPARADVLAYAARADGAVAEALARLRLTSLEEPRVREGLFTALEHEAMHQETLLYMWRRLPYDAKEKPPGLAYQTGGLPPRPHAVAIPAGRAMLGARRDAVLFGWDNEFDEHEVSVPAFEIDAYAVTNAEFRAFVEDAGYAREELWSARGWEWVRTGEVRHPAFWVEADGGWYWRGMFEPIPLPPGWPVYVSHAEAEAYARWRGRRLPSEPEYHRAAEGVPWPSSEPNAGGGGRASGSLAEGVPRSGNFDFAQWEPVPAGAAPEGASAHGVHDLVGNGWEWTSTLFAPFPGFSPMPSYPEYSVEFFDGEHYVLKGASPATAKDLVRRSFRNWFRPTYPYVYAKFRTAADLDTGTGKAG